MWKGAVENTSVVQADPQAERICAHVLELAKRDLAESSYNMWFAEIRAGELSGTVLELVVPSDYVRDWLARNHSDLIDTAVKEATDGSVTARLVSDIPRPKLPSDAPVEDVVVLESPRAMLTFPDRYTFDAFVPGPSNRFAHAAAMAVAEAPPSKAYNPLFIYGGVGLGKTHLLYAIGHHMTRLIPGLRVKYVSSETFVTDFIKAVRERQGYQFQRRYRDVDVLLVDDIQVLAKREETQTEFFHTFNALHGSERQIVIASDRAPGELSGMEDRLRNRFRWGLCVDVRPPDLETRIAILQLKARRDQIEVPDDVLDLIASKFDQNIRELEGALLRVAAFSSLMREPITLQISEDALEDLLPQPGSEIPAPMILDETASYFGLTREDLVS